MNEKYNLFPKKHILPYDGMSITANVWAEAHEYHQQMLEAHHNYLHGEGIVTGLKVIASDPADHVVFILPGVAIDSAGKMIVLSEPVAYDFGEKISGKLHLDLVHREVKLVETRTDENNQPAYLQNDYVIIARAEPLDAPHVEIARINNLNPQKPITDAQDPATPRENEIDLRYRKTIPIAQHEQVTIGVSYYGNIPVKTYAQGLIQLNPLAQMNTPYQWVVENDFPLNKDLFLAPLVNLVVDPKTPPSSNLVELLHMYLQYEGKIYLEFISDITESQMIEYVKQLQISIEKIQAPHPVFQAPFLFNVPPQGGFTSSTPSIWFGDPGFVVSNGGYGRIWSGQEPGAAFPRSVIRDAQEWGINLMTYLLGH
jgi:hypothetical protein